MPDDESCPDLRLAASSGNNSEAGMSQRSHSRLAPARGDSASATACDSSGTPPATNPSCSTHSPPTTWVDPWLARSLAAASSVPTPARPEQRTEPRLASPPPNARGSGWIKSRLLQSKTNSRFPKARIKIPAPTRGKARDGREGFVEGREMVANKRAGADR